MDKKLIQSGMTLLQSIRHYMLENNIDVVLVNICNRFDNMVSDMSDIECLCGFTGTAGDCIIMLDRAILCVDGRYEKQAAAQVDTVVWQVVCDSFISVISKIRRDNPEAKIVTSGESLNYSVYEKLGCLRYIHYDFFDGIYKHNNRKVVKSHFYDDHIDRLWRFRGVIGDHCAVICDSNLIAWLFCIRMDSLQDFSPIPRAMAYVSKDDAILFCDLDLGDKFDFNIMHYSSMNDIIDADKNILADPSSTPCMIWRNNFTAYKFPHLEAVKSTKEIDGMKTACRHASDAFERALKQIELCKTEQDVADLLYEEMSKCPDFVGFSFDPIVASGVNSRIIHYTERNSIIRDGILLIDVGGQYEYGTTDMTRTVWIGDCEPPRDVRAYYCAVKNAVDMFSNAKFPAGTRISTIDGFARYHIWQICKDYKFGTGHGVGCYANVHEYPRISQFGQDCVLEPGNIITVEPGIYTDDYGVRIENMLLVVEVCDGFLGFETLNGVGYDTRLAL